MPTTLFIPADILLPNENILPELWSVVACDQFSSEREYWERVKERVGESPSTLNMIIPEAYLGEIDEEGEIRKISYFMEKYADQGVFRVIENSFIYVERTQIDGKVRSGLVGALDLEEYDFSVTDAGAASSAVLASEGTALDRLPPRIRIREAASLELPHIMIFIADIDKTVIEPLAKKTEGLEPLYDFELMEGGGRIRGVRISGHYSIDVMKALNDLHERKKAESPQQCLMIMGDGNHSLAAAKSHWNEIKTSLTDAEREAHSARYALVEINNLYDSAIGFEPIHRVVYEVDAEKLVSDISNISLSENFDGETAKEKVCSKAPSNNYCLQILSSYGEKTVTIGANSASELIAEVQFLLDEYIARFGGRIDYIHDTGTLRKLVNDDNCVGILLPAVSKQEFLDVVTARKIFPRKSFSVGHARDKRYYMECRRIEN
jgi:uncharacterized protein (DUF1015 family)